MQKLSNWNDTIVALATPPGIGAIGVVRLSGDRAIAIAASMFTSKDLTVAPTHTAHVGLLRQQGVVLDEVVVTLFRAPKSYTGEDVVEISGHGSPFVLEQLIQACIQQGARIARPGEFTQRAFLNGKLDLAQAEAVADLIASNTAASRRAAITHLRGGFSEALKVLRAELLKFSALIELELDFAEEDVEFADRAQFNLLLNNLSDTVDQLLDSFLLGNVVKNGVEVAIIGRPNAGKSTLLNALLNEDRAIVSAVAGTTRDTIEETLNIGGLLFRLVDTAGIRMHTTDEIEKIGVARALDKRRMADIVIYLFDLTDVSSEELRNAEADLLRDGLRYVLVGNKADDAASTFTYTSTGPMLSISAKKRQGIDELRKMLVDIVTGGKLDTEATLVTNARHHAALQELSKALSGVKTGLENRLTGDLLSLDIRNCLHWLGEITGEITNEEQLDYIFSKFCIGK